MKRLRLALQEEVKFPLPDKLRSKIPVVENTDELLDSIQLLWCQGRTDRQCRQILRISQAHFIELIALLKTTSVRAETAEQAYAQFVDEYTKFKLRAEGRLAQLNDLLDKVQKPDPMGDKLWYTTGKIRSIIRNMSRLDKQLRDASVELLSIKIRLGLVIPPNQKPEQAQKYLPGEPLPEQALFSSNNVREAWKQRLLSNGNGNSRN
jgi:hypothetical protein